MRIASQGPKHCGRSNPQARGSASVRAASQPDLPEAIHEIVSEYGYISSDEPGGSLKEVRLVLTIDGLKWKTRQEGPERLWPAASARRDAKNPGPHARKLRGLRVARFPFRCRPVDFAFRARRRGEVRIHVRSQPKAGAYGPMWVYKYQQLDGGQAFTIYGGKEPIRQRLARRALGAGPSDSDAVPRHAWILTHSVNESEVRDVTAVDYEMSQWGLLLPFEIDHRQYVDKQLFVIDEFTYTDFKQTIPGKLR